MAQIKDLIALAQVELKNSTTPRLDSELLLAHVLGRGREYLLAHASEVVDHANEQKFFEILARRNAFEPIAYIIGEKEFYSISFSVNDAVLVPRPDSELLVSAALKFSESLPDPISMLDLGTGSGCLIIALALELKKAGRRGIFSACDKSERALEVAKHNASKHAVLQQISFIKSDWFSALNDKFDIIVCNPPYVAEGAKDLSPELVHEPKQALFAGADGMSEICKILNALPNFLKPRSNFFCEIGSDQDKLFTQHAKNLFGDEYRLEFLQDLSGINRVAVLNL